MPIGLQGASLGSKVSYKFYTYRHGLPSTLAECFLHYSRLHYMMKIYKFHHWYYAMVTQQLLTFMPSQMISSED